MQGPEQRKKLMRKKITNKQVQRYSLFAIILHWVMALGFFAVLGMGLYMNHVEIEKFLQFQMYQWHKSLGVLLLLGLGLRLVVRFSAQRPDLPESLPWYERWAAKLGHFGLYLWMFLLPLSGWIMVSASVIAIPTIVFGWFEWPHLPYITTDAELEEWAKLIHHWLAYSFMGLIAIHAGAVVKHWVFDKENLLTRMGIGRKSKEK